AIMPDRKALADVLSRVDGWSVRKEFQNWAAVTASRLNVRIVPRLYRPDRKLWPRLGGRVTTSMPALVTHGRVWIPGAMNLGQRKALDWITEGANRQGRFIPEPEPGRVPWLLLYLDHYGAIAERDEASAAIDSTPSPPAAITPA